MKFYSTKEVSQLTGIPQPVLSANCGAGVIPAEKRPQFTHLPVSDKKGSYNYVIPETVVDDLKSGKIKPLSTSRLYNEKHAVPPKLSKAQKALNDSQAIEHVRLDVLNRLVVAQATQLDALAKRVRKLEEAAAYWEARYGTLPVPGQGGV